jgi:hypothetical protein
VSFTISDAQGLEGTNLIFTVTRSGGSGATHTVRFNAVAGTARMGMDYVRTSGTLTFGPTQTTATISVRTLSDGLVEGNEVFYVDLSSPSAGATISRSQGVSTIFDAGVTR